MRGGGFDSRHLHVDYVVKVLVAGLYVRPGGFVGREWAARPLRHGHASMLIDLGVNPLAVAQRMGHSDPSVTLREYGHLFDGVQERISDQLDELRRQSAPVVGPGTISRLDERRRT
jgi:integrase